MKETFTLERQYELDHPETVKKNAKLYRTRHAEKIKLKRVKRVKRI